MAEPKPKRSGKKKPVVPSAEVSGSRARLYFGKHIAAEVAVADAVPDVDLERHVDRRTNVEVVPGELKRVRKALMARAKSGCDSVPPPGSRRRLAWSTG